jgi:hypothetical protein
MEEREVMSEASGRMEGYDQEGTGWLPPVDLLPAKTVSSVEYGRKEDES